MKICPRCSQTYSDDSLNYCLNDGVALDRMSGPESTDSVQTAVLNQTSYSAGPTVPFGVQPTNLGGEASMPDRYGPPAQAKSRSWLWVLLILGGLFLLCGGGAFGLVALKLRSGITESEKPDTFTLPEVPSTQKPAPTIDKTNDLSGDEYDLTLEQYNRISIGMRRSEVEKLLGGQGTEISSTTGGGMSFTVDQWEGENYKSIILSFQNDKVVSKSQVGLK